MIFPTTTTLAVFLGTILVSSEAKNVPRPNIPSWSKDGSIAPLLPPIPRYRHRGGYAAAPPSGEYLKGKEQHAVDGDGCGCLECKCRTGHQSIEVAVIEE